MTAVGQLSSLGGSAAARRFDLHPRVDDEETLRRKAEELEGFFLSQMLQPMFANIETAEPFGGGLAEQMWRSLEIDEFGKAMARAGGIGLADSVMREMLALQEQGGTPA